MKLVRIALSALTLSLCAPVVASAETQDPDAASEESPEIAPDAVVESSPSLYVGAGGGFAYAPLTYHVPWAIEAGLRPGTLPLWLRGKLAYGADVSDFDSSVLMAEIGGEARLCSSGGLVCGVGGIDVGYAHVNYPILDDSWGVGIVDPRVGLDVGARSVRVRATVGPRIAFDGDVTDYGFTGELSLQYYH